MVLTDVKVAPVVERWLKYDAARIVAGNNHGAIRFLLVNRDGSLHDKNDYGKATAFAFSQKAAAQRWVLRHRGQCLLAMLDCTGQVVCWDGTDGWGNK
jgi:hypothetical protein